MLEVANWPPLPRRQIQLMNHPATKQKTTLKHLSSQKNTLKIKEDISKQRKSFVEKMRVRFEVKVWRFLRFCYPSLIILLWIKSFLSSLLRQSKRLTPATLTSKTTMPVNLKAKSHVQWTRKAGFSLNMSDERKNRFARAINEVFWVKRF